MATGKQNSESGSKTIIHIEDPLLEEVRRTVKMIKKIPGESDTIFKEIIKDAKEC